MPPPQPNSQQLGRPPPALLLQHFRLRQPGPSTTRHRKHNRHLHLHSGQTLADKSSLINVEKEGKEASAGLLSISHDSLASSAVECSPGDPLTNDHDQIDQS